MRTTPAARSHFALYFSKSNMSSYVLICFLLLTLIVYKSESQSPAVKNVLRYANAFRDISRAVRGGAGAGAGIDAGSGRGGSVAAALDSVKSSGRRRGGMLSGMGRFAGGFMTDGFGMDSMGGDLFSGAMDKGTDFAGSYDGGW